MAQLREYLQKIAESPAFQGVAKNAKEAINEVVRLALQNPEPFMERFYWPGPSPFGTPPGLRFEELPGGGNVPVHINSTRTLGGKP